jgi:membrane protein involved in colicin uptake
MSIPIRQTWRSKSKSSKFAVLWSVLLHSGILVALLFWFQSSSVQQIVAAGEGEGGEGGGGAIEVGIADAKQILGFAKPQTVAFIGDEKETINNTRVETERAKPDESDEALLPPTEKPTPKPDAVKTDRPVAPQEEKIFTGKEEHGGSTSQTAQVGRSYGSPTPGQVGGVSLGNGGGYGAGTGLPGGSAYGRLIQQILSRNYNPPVADSATPQEVIIKLRIAPDGTILSISNGRIASEYIKQRSTMALVNNAAERAILVSNPLPALQKFYPDKREATVDVIFRYPK